MHTLPAIFAAVAGAALCSIAVAQDGAGSRPLDPPAATTGAAPRETVGQGTFGAPIGGTVGAPIGHRQPNAATVPSPGAAPGAVVSPYDQEIDRNLNICRGC
jgi:hypothetical protein